MEWFWRRWRREAPVDEAAVGVYTLLVGPAVLEETLFHFLVSLRTGRAQALRPVLATQATLQAVYQGASPLLWEAWRQCLEGFLLEVSPDPARWGTLQVPASVLGLTLALHNCLAPKENAEAPGLLVQDFTTALVASLPPARNRNAALAYHAVLRCLDGLVPLLPPVRAGLVQALLERSPLTALWALDVHTPLALQGLAAELLRGWQPRPVPEPPLWPNQESWLEIISTLLTEPLLARWLRQRWLALPESLWACRNVGLVLEALRRQGGQRHVLLEFYEAYDHRCTRRGARAGTGGEWPLLRTMATLLRATGDDAVALRLNRRGNAHFLKFYPLVQLVIAEGGVPTDYAHLRWEFVLALRALLPYVTLGARQHAVFSAVEFPSPQA